jgi:hypothetical protein
MKKVSTASGKATKNLSQPKLTIGLDLGDRFELVLPTGRSGEILRERPSLALLLAPLFRAFPNLKLDGGTLPCRRHTVGCCFWHEGFVGEVAGNYNKAESCVSEAFSSAKVLAGSPIQADFHFPILGEFHQPAEWSFGAA